MVRVVRAAALLATVMAAQAKKDHSFLDSYFCTELKAMLTGHKVVVPSDDAEYDSVRYQYAYSSVPLRVAPSGIVVADTVDDVRKAVRHAGICGYKVVPRSGGHQYDGLSSCNGDERPCLQVDLSRFDTIEIEDTSVTVGAGVHLDSLYEALAERSLFIGGGECAKVATGGHAQTGGVGLLGRSFGLFGDHVVAFHIVLADGSHRRVVKPTGKKGSGFYGFNFRKRHNDRLYWAVMGGGAGSWGIVTSWEMRANRDEDYPHSTYFQCMLPFSKELLKDMVETYNAVTGTAAFLGEDRPEESVWLTTVKAAPIVADHIHMEGLWAGVSGAFDNSTYAAFYEAAAGRGVCSVQPMPPSKVLPIITFPGDRETPFPYVRRSVGIKGKLDGGLDVEQYVEKMDALRSTDGLLGVSQIVSVGGRIRSNDPDAEVTSYPLRDANFIVGVNVFYASVLNPDAHSNAVAYHNDAWYKINVSERDWRYIWSTWGDLDIAAVWQHYYDSPKNFKKLRIIKKLVDPLDIFQTSFTVPPITRKI